MRSLLSHVRLATCASVLVGCVLAGCNGTEERPPKAENLADYVVVSVHSDVDIESYFDFSSVDRVHLETYFGSDDNLDSGVYSAGHLSDGNCIVWRSDDDGYGYDDCLFVYVEEDLSGGEVPWIKYAEKLGEEPIDFEEFLREYM